MASVRTFIDRYILVIAMALGVIGYRVFGQWGEALPYLIFLMLFFTFCKIDPRNLRLHTWHAIALVVQLALGAAVYALVIGLSHWNVIASLCSHDEWHMVAQSLMLCVLMPTATAAPIVAGKLGGSIQNLTTFTLISNIATALIVPAVFPLVNPSSNIAFLQAAGLILLKVSPLLIGPFLAAWLIRLLYDGWQKAHHSAKRFALPYAIAPLPFYIWSGTLVILLGQVTDTIVHTQVSALLLIVLSALSLLLCVEQFVIGSRIGHRWPALAHGDDYVDDRMTSEELSPAEVTQITVRQAFGQKNTTLGVWMAIQFLLPLASIGPAAYIVWQNLINSWELQHIGKTHKSYK